jgi:hypothetical protein
MHDLQTWLSFCWYLYYQIALNQNKKLYHVWSFPVMNNVLIASYKEHSNKKDDSSATEEL